MILAFGQLCLFCSRSLNPCMWNRFHLLIGLAFTHLHTKKLGLTDSEPFMENYKNIIAAISSSNRRSKLTPCHRKEQITFSITRILMYSICIQRNEQFYVHISLDPKDQYHNWTSKHVEFCNLRKRKPSIKGK